MTPLSGRLLSPRPTPHISPQPKPQTPLPFLLCTICFAVDLSTNRGAPLFSIHPHNHAPRLSHRHGLRDLLQQHVELVLRVAASWWLPLPEEDICACGCRGRCAYGGPIKRRSQQRAPLGVHTKTRIVQMETDAFPNTSNNKCTSFESTKKKQSNPYI